MAFYIWKHDQNADRVFLYPFLGGEEIAADGRVVISTALDNKGFQKGIQKISGSLGGLQSVLGKLAGVIGGAFAVHKVVEFGKEAVHQTNRMRDAMLGLQSILQGQGRDFQKAKAFIQEYTADGLIPATNAITAYKNLAARKYSDSQIQQVLIALKDSAAFGRQASYTMGEAVQSATEGLKNENSILVDNAGVTKNVAKMWEDYAHSIGTTANRLTQQQKIQAEVSGILEESKYQTGDAAKVAGTYSGQLMRLSFLFNDLKVAVGNAVIPVAQRVLPVIQTMIAAFTRLANAAAAVMGAIFGKANVQTAALAQHNEAVASSAGAGAAAENKLAQNTQKAGKAAKGALAAFDELNVLQQDTGSGAGASSAPGGGTASGTVGSVPITAELEIEDTLSPQLQAVLDKVHKLLEPLQKINFEPLAKSFDRLKQAAAPLTETLFSGLEWAYYNIFVPLAAWTIEDALPAFLDVLAGAMNLLNAALEALAPLGQWLWKNFLQPISAWTGGIIVAVLGLIADGLNRISQWISKNQVLVQDLAIVLASFGVAWALVNGAFAIWNGLVAVWNGLSQLATVGTTLFSAALNFLAANPIVLVIAAIGALIAIVVLMVRHWDRVKEVLRKLGNWLLNVFAWVWTNVFGTVIQGVMDAFFYSVGNIVAGIERFFKGILKFIGGVFTGDWKSAWNGIKDIFGGVFQSLVGLAKAPINTIIGFINGMIQAVTNGINGMIGVLNHVSFDIPDWIPGLGGRHFGLNIPTVKTPQIPMLAHGAVLPANHPFLAMVGDQHSGTNVEAPLDTIKQALAEVLAQIPQQEQEIVLNLVCQGNMAQLIRVMKPYLEREGRRVGVKLVTGGEI